MSNWKKHVRSPYFFPVLLHIALAVGYITIRMRGVEQDYKYNALIKEHSESDFRSKELLAKKAKLLSVKNLRGFASKYKLRAPASSQVILISE